MSSLVLRYTFFSSLVRNTARDMISGLANLPSSTASLINVLFDRGNDLYNFFIFWVKFIDSSS